MKNTIKMSLVAAIAAAGFSTAASAGSLEDAIKGVSIKGKMEVEYEWSVTEDSTGAESGHKNNWDYDIDVTAKVPVNDMVTAVIGLEADHEQDVNTDVPGGISSPTSNPDAAVDISAMYFQYANGPVTAMLGKTPMFGAPWFDDDKANGALVLYNAGPATLAAGHFTGSNASNVNLETADISALAAIGSVGPVNMQLWYANLSGISVGAADVDADSIVFLADASIEMVSLEVKYGQTDYDIVGGGSDENEMLQVWAEVDLGMITPYVSYAQTDDITAGAGLDLTGDDDAEMNWGLEEVKIDDYSDAEAWMIGAKAKMGAWKADVAYLDGERDITGGKGDFNELKVNVEYKLSKNFTIDTYYAIAEIDTSMTNTDDVDNMEIALEYKF